MLDTQTARLRTQTPQGFKIFCQPVFVLVSSTCDLLCGLGVYSGQTTESLYRLEIICKEANTEVAGGAVWWWPSVLLPPERACSRLTIWQ